MKRKPRDGERGAEPWRSPLAGRAEAVKSTVKMEGCAGRGGAERRRQASSLAATLTHSGQ